MPSDVFMKLDVNKRNKILDAAKLEFSNYSFEDASINRIIKSINMPRGTFYLYFENKDDLYDYIFLDYENKLDNIFIDELKSNDGDIFIMFKNAFSIICNKANNNAQALVKNYFINLNSRKHNSFFPDGNNKRDISHIIKWVNIDKYGNDNLKFILEMVFPMFFHDVAFALINDDKDKVMVSFNKKLLIIKNGVEKEGL